MTSESEKDNIVRYEVRTRQRQKYWKTCRIRRKLSQPRNPRVRLAFVWPGFRISAVLNHFSFLTSISSYDIRRLPKSSKYTFRLLTN